MPTVLVTGGSGFVAIHILRLLLNTTSHTVRTTVRSDAKKQVVLDMLHRAETSNIDKLSFYIADLTSDDGWQEAIQGCEYVVNPASPMFATSNPDEMLKPAVDGCLRILRFSRDCGVKRLVYTSTCGAVYYGFPPTTQPYDESSFTNLESTEMSLYVRSKAMAEQAAWDFIKKEGENLEFSVVNPSGIFGPALGPDFSESLQLIKKLVDGSLPACPDLWFGVVDVRDVAELHLRAMEAPEAAGERFICTAPGGAVSMLAIARELKEKLGTERGAKVPTRRLPNWVVWLMSFVNQQMADLLPLLGNIRNATPEKAKRLLGWEAKVSWKESVLSTAESLYEIGVVGGTK